MTTPDDGTRTTALLRARLGLTLESVTEEWHWYLGRPSAPLRFWLHFTRVPALRLHGVGELLHLEEATPGSSYDLGAHGEGKIGPAHATSPLARYIGSRLRDATLIRASATNPSVGGVLLRFGSGDLAVASSADEWVIGAGELPGGAAPFHCVETMSVSGRLS